MRRARNSSSTKLLAVSRRGWRVSVPQGDVIFLSPNAWYSTTTPLSLLFQDEQKRSTLQDLHLLFNESLEVMLDDSPDTVHRFDAFGLSREIVSDPTSFGFIDELTVCPAGSTNCDGLMWRDLLHPASPTHRILADRGLAAIPEPSTGLQLAKGLSALTASSRRRIRNRSRLMNPRTVPERGGVAPSGLSCQNT